jgi:hypothetical protein
VRPIETDIASQQTEKAMQCQKKAKKHGFFRVILVEVGRVGCKFSLKDFYAQTIEKFVVAIPDMIESCRIAKKVSGNQKTSKSNVEDLPCQKFVI